MTRRVEVVPHNPNWRSAFENESKQVAVALADNVVAVHHIGSTSIPTIYAKPIIDMLVKVREIAKVDEQNLAMQALGYEAKGEYGISGRRYFRKENEAGMRTHHIHVFEVHSAQVERHLAFRDYMRVHPEDAQKYSQLKQKLAKQYPNDVDGYVNGKDEFIKDIDKKAAEWRNS
ncbi:MAG: GrpB family protein [Anaerolineae bacterium]|nr:GrpB family protein [Gloeobacterales cyanobacterium ES-bin-313]